MFNRSKIWLITSPQNRGHLTHPNFEVSTSAHNCAHLYSAQNYAQQNYGVNITQPKTWLITSAQNCAYFTHLNFGASTSIQFWILLHIVDVTAIWTRAQNCVHPIHPFLVAENSTAKLKYIPPIFHAGKLCEMR